jgi:hypothetical protein
MNYHGLVKRLSLPDEWMAPSELSYEDIRAFAINRDHLDDDVRGINASLDLIRRTRGGRWPAEPVTYDVDVSWWVTPDAYAHGYYSKLYAALRQWTDTRFPFWKPYYSNTEIPS